MFRIRRFGVIKTATMVAAMYFAVIVIVFLVFVPFVAIARVSINGVPQPTGLDIGAGGSLVGLLVLGVVAAAIYSLVGWVVTAIACLLYNFVAGFVGGIEVQLEQLMPPPPPAAVSGTPSPTAPSPPAPPAGT